MIDRSLTQRDGRCISHPQPSKRKAETTGANSHLASCVRLRFPWIRSHKCCVFLISHERTSETRVTQAYIECDITANCLTQVLVLVNTSEFNIVHVFTTPVLVQPPAS